MDYVIAVQAPAYRVSEDLFATESAFSAHLQELKASIGPKFSRLVLIAPFLGEAQYRSAEQHLGQLSAQRDGIVFLPAYPTSSSRVGFWLKHLAPVWRLARQAVRSAGIVQSGMSTQLGQPLMFIVSLAGWLAGKPVVFIVDIDFRRHAERYYRLGQWSLKSYVVNRYVYDPLKSLQVWLAPRLFTLVCLKSASLVRDFGQGRPNVRNFYDTVHSDKDILTEDEIDEKQRAALDVQRPLVVGYFGRLVANKGLDRVVEAIRLARQAGADVSLRVIGEGECQSALEQQVQQAGLEAHVAFWPAVPYGEPLFAQLRDVHVSVAAPLIEDTPRAAFDSMARGIPLVAFDITYFRDLERESGAVTVSPWPEPEGLARSFVALAADRSRLAQMTQRAVTFARANTQPIWLRRRTDWILELT